MTETFRAAEFRGDGVARLTRYSGVDPGPGEILVAPRAVGLCATDREICDGTMAYYRMGLASYPVIPGHEWCGTVVAVGDGVEVPAVGDRVVGECSVGCGRCRYCRMDNYHVCPDRTETGIMHRPGALCERLLFPAASAHVVPDGISDLAAALVEPTAVALNVVSVAGLQDDDEVLVLGAGTIGLLAAQAAMALGCGRVLVGDRSEMRLLRAAELGVDAVLDVSGTPPTDHPEIGRHGVDVVIEATGKEGGLTTALRAVRPGGTVCVVSLYGRPQLPVDLDLIVTKDLTLRGAVGSPRRWPRTLSLIASGAVRPEMVVTSRYGLDEIAGAVERLRASAPAHIKTIVEPGGAAT